MNDKTKRPDVVDKRGATREKKEDKRETSDGALKKYARQRAGLR